jgi:uncharacterized BrkB/YihY/UPF0761 family membrane protein
MTESESPLPAGANRHILFEAGSEFMEDRALRLGAGLAYYGLINRFGTDGNVSWSAVWPGTILTMVLLTVLVAGYGIYVDLSGTSITGIASSAILLIVLVYFMAQVMLYGGEVIKVQSRRDHT